MSRLLITVDEWEASPNGSSSLRRKVARMWSLLRDICILSTAVKLLRRRICHMKVTYSAESCMAYRVGTVVGGGYASGQHFGCLAHVFLVYLQICIV